MRKTILFFIGFMLTLNLAAQQQLWRVGTALTMPKGWFDKGIFQPLRYGLFKRTELSTYPVTMFLMPNLAIKQRWYTTPNKWFISSKHGVYYPSMALKRLSGRGKWNLLPERTTVPFLLPSYHEVLASKFLKENTLCTCPDLLLTLKLGVKFSIGWAEELKMSTIDYPFIFHPTQPYYKKIMWYTGADLEGHFTEFINYSVDVNFQAIDLLRSWNASHKGLLVIPWTDRWTVAAGYQLQYGKFPYGNDFTITPLIDLSYKFTIRKKNKMQFGLFQKLEFKHNDFQELDDPIETDPYQEYYPEEKRRKKEEKGKKKKEKSKGKEDEKTKKK